MSTGKQKILVIRFSSIGDIVLTSPVVRCLHRQLPGAEIHFCTKEQYAGIVRHNPYIHKLHLLNDKGINELTQRLQLEHFDYVIDLHKNLRTRLLKLKLGIPSSAFHKLNIRKWLLVNLKINRMPPVHIVHRYLAAAAPLGITDDGEGLDFFIAPDQEINLSELPVAFQTGYAAVAIGAQHFTKRMPAIKITEFCRELNLPVLLLGGPEDVALGDECVQLLQGHLPVVNTCGKYSLAGSASLVKQASLLLTNDTGLMHIGAAFRIKTYSVWGSTVPEFGMYPFRTPFYVLENNNLSCRPCSKIGYDKCPRGHLKCMNDLKWNPVERTG